MRFTDVLLSVPTLFLIILMVAVFQSGDIGAGNVPIWAVAFTLGVLGWPGTARIIRAEFLRLRELEYTEAARALGASDFSIIFKHLVPNSMAPVIVNLTIGVAYNILTEAGLAFLGFGDPSAVSWGTLINAGFFNLEQAWWVASLPGFAIFFAVMGFNLAGDGLRDALDPRLKQ